ncbi:phage baseplate assembly protein V [Methylobacterium gnaphalii]|uniref:Gp5/Type VI secretion system Vgr protein OB-fold domain-containing protein n=1 Tax=Methylobacterium gnaphalii TaxID=1010610 RepID=A0A512JPD8_9HYPH|nr:phage baseplate assembly protein V [Methylobacterium gnaphalii]GEP11817.1 hypothetical protein MGN01_36620 [Methylobacterium gnaphalii]GJD70865.1 hypothetical protein MMMDOFMJ_3818 [Methylobacterium gnaphalii]GLS49548.1 hypothetical protein GCM10007885_23970 [Methylobacterium gnaphalii]
MSDLGEMISWLQRLERDHRDLKAAVRNMFRVGPVVARDKDKGVRLQTDADGEDGSDPHKTDWGVMAEQSGFHSRVPRNGEQCLFLAPFGDQAQGVVLPFGHNTAHPNPAGDVDEIVLFNHGKIKGTVDKTGTKLTITNDKASTVYEGAKITHTIDGNSTTYEKDQITFPDGSKVHHGTQNIGKDHVHLGVEPGGGKSQGPDV